MLPEGFIQVTYLSGETGTIAVSAIISFDANGAGGSQLVVREQGMRHVREDISELARKIVESGWKLGMEPKG